MIVLWHGSESNPIAASCVFENELCTVMVNAGKFAMRYEHFRASGNRVADEAKAQAIAEKIAAKIETERKGSAHGSAPR